MTDCIGVTTTRSQALQHALWTGDRAGFNYFGGILRHYHLGRYR